MKRFIRDRKTKAFLSLDGFWVHNVSLARNFEDVSAAVFACLQHPDKKELELLYAMDEGGGKYDIAIPLFRKSNQD